MKFIRFFIFGIFISSGAFALSDFDTAAQMLSAAKNGDIKYLEQLVNNGADINYIDNTGMSIVCTALMNNDIRAAQILQMYGADASKCDRQIKKYKNKDPNKKTGGLFSGLSTAQEVALTTAGGIAVVGGLFFLTDKLKGSNNNIFGSNSNRPNNNGGSGGTGGHGGNNNTHQGDSKALTSYGPSLPSAEAEKKDYANNLNSQSGTDDTSIARKNFNSTTQLDSSNNVVSQYNHLLAMRGYSPFARGYLGMTTLRNDKNEPLKITGDLEGHNISGGKPVNVALITSNGLNINSDLTADESSLQDRLFAYTSKNVNGSLNNGSRDTVSNKYYNNEIINKTHQQGSQDIQNGISEWKTQEKEEDINNFDLSGAGTALHNKLIDNDDIYDPDNMLAKIVGGYTSGKTSGDITGFMPNGQMTVYRTGGGYKINTLTGQGKKDYEDVANGIKVKMKLSGDTVDTEYIFDKIISRSNYYKILKAGKDTGYRAYIKDGKMYLYNSRDENTFSTLQVYNMDSGNKKIELIQNTTQTDYKNYEALLHASNLSDKDDKSGFAPSVIANVALNPKLFDNSSKTITSLISYDKKDEYKNKFKEYVNEYYSFESDKKQGQKALDFFENTNKFTIFSTGWQNIDSSGKSLEASFENSAPLVFNRLKNIFATVVSVSVPTVKKADNLKLSEYKSKNKIELSAYQIGSKKYKSRICGISGTGTKDTDPWCFAAIGNYDGQAVASMAGSVGILKSAFNYMDNKQLFALLALTADGPFCKDCAKNSEGKDIEEKLKNYLDGMYKLPSDYQSELNNNPNANYLELFKKVFGYGLINLERATTPGKTIYYYNGDRILSSKKGGNAYWGDFSKTRFGSSSVLRPRLSKISAQYYDMLESPDKSLSLPRIWKHNFNLNKENNINNISKNIFESLQPFTRNSEQKIDNFSFALSSSGSRLGNFSDLNNFNIKYEKDNFNFTSSFKNNLTDNLSNFEGRENQILSLVSNLVIADTKYSLKNFSFKTSIFSGDILDKNLISKSELSNSLLESAKFGSATGFSFDVSFNKNSFNISSSIGKLNEKGSVLGTGTGGLLDLGSGDTIYLDNRVSYKLTNDINLQFNFVTSQTKTNSRNEQSFIKDITDIYSNAYSINADYKSFSFSISRPLTVYSGDMTYAYSDFNLVPKTKGGYGLSSKYYLDKVSLSPNKELRFVGTYRKNLGIFTDSVFNFIYRVNPDGFTDKNETILMMKLSHRLGI